MTNFDPNDRLIRALAMDLTPVRGLPRMRRSVFIWVVFLAAVAIAFAIACDLDALARRFSAAPDLCVAALGSMLTALLGAIAAFQLNLPDRKPIWILVPVPAAVLWIGASGIGCLRPWAVADGDPVSLGGTDHCLIFILGLSIPLSIFLIAMLRQGYSLRPTLTSIAAGLACAAAAATLLNFVHLHDASALDTAIHAAAVTTVILANRIFGARLLQKKLSTAP